MSDWQSEVNANALLRFYVLHCMILPLTAIFFVAIHFWRIRKDGGLYSHGSEPAVVRAQAASQRATEITAGVKETR